MPLSFQERMRLIAQKLKNNQRLWLEVVVSESSSKSILENSACCSQPTSRGCKPLISTLRGCFLHSTKTLEDKGITFDNLTDNPLNLTRDAQEKSPAVIIFTLSELMKATDNFSPSLKIGQGGFGTVYKGRLKDGSFVAIKRAKKNFFDGQLCVEFRNEVSTLSGIEHLNLVKLIGYAEEGSERVLVVEYIANGNLREHLDGRYGTVLDLATRLDIAIDVAHALTYLHLYADRSIIHRDIKSSNILLTENFRAKVADFGFSRLGPTDFDGTHISTQVKGTAGYMDPEYLKTFQLTQKSDVYSFGVLLVELFTGRRPIEHKRESRERITTRWAFEMFVDGKGIETLDPKLERSLSAYMMVEKVLELAFQCAAPTKQERPTMKRTAEVLWNVRRDYQNFWQHRLCGADKSKIQINKQYLI